MEDYLHIFIRDELLTWQLTSRKPIPSPAQFRDQVIQNAEVVTKRAEALSCQIEREQVRRYSFSFIFNESHVMSYNT